MFPFLTLARFLLAFFSLFFLFFSCFHSFFFWGGEGSQVLFSLDLDLKLFFLFLRAKEKTIKPNSDSAPSHHAPTGAEVTVQVPLLTEGGLFERSCQELLPGYACRTNSWDVRWSTSRGGSRGIKRFLPTSVIQANPPLYEENSLWEALSVVSQKWSFPTALGRNVWK